MRISWTPLSLCPATRAYALPSISNAATPAEPASSPKPPAPSVAESAALSVPLSWMRISWTPLPPHEGAIAYASSPILKAAMSYMS